MDAFLDSSLFTWVILPFLIFLARIGDQSIATMRFIFSAKGLKKVTAILGFFETLIWVIAITQIIKHLDNVLCYVAYAGGFAAGSYIGIWIEERLSIGNVIVRVMPKKNTDDLVAHLRSHGYGVTTVDVQGMNGSTKMVFSIIKRKNTPQVIDIINEFNPNAFYTIEEVRAVSEGYMKDVDSGGLFNFKRFRVQRK